MIMQLRAEPAGSAPRWAVAPLRALAGALDGVRLVVPEGIRIGPLLAQCRHLAALLPPEAPVAAAADRPPLVVPHAALAALDDRAALAGLLAVPEETLAQLRAGQGLLVLDGANEGRAFSRTRVARMHAVLAEAGIPPGRAAWVQQNRRMPRLYAQAFGPPEVAPLRVLVGHSHAAELWRRLATRDGLNWRFGFALEHGGARRHRWVCLNYALRPHRALLAAWLLERPEKGFLSFSVTQAERARVGVGKLLDGAARLGGEDAEGARAAVARLVASGSHHASDLDGFATPAKRVYSLPAEEVAAAELFIVTETEMETPGLLRWTEKTLKALASGLPFVVFGNPGVVAGLRRLGFDVLEDLVDHGYDAVAAPAQRFAAARAEVARFLARRPGFTPAELERLRAAAAANRAVFLRVMLRDSLLRPVRQILDAVAEPAQARADSASAGG